MKKSTLFLIILVAIFFTSTLVLIYLNYLKPQSISPTPISTESISPTPNPTADWKTYENKEYGFEFKYPDYFNFKNVTGSGGDIDMVPLKLSLKNNNSEFSISVQKINCNQTPNIALYGNKNFYNSSDFQSFDGLFYSLNSYSTNLKNNICLIISKYTSSPDISSEKILKETDFNDFNEILSTFKFTNQSQVEEFKPQVGFIKKIYIAKNGLKYIDVDYVQWVNDKMTPDGYRIVNDNSQIRTLNVSSSAVISVIDWTDQGIFYPKISFRELQDIFDHTNVNYEIEKVDQQPFDIEFNSSNQVSKISLRFTP